MDVDDVIALHQARLNEHRKFLEIDLTGCDTKPPTPTATNSDCVLKATSAEYPADAVLFSPSPVEPNGEASIDFALPTFDPVIFSAFSQPNQAGDDLNGGQESGKSAKNTCNEKSLQRTHTVASNHEIARKSSDLSHHKRIVRQSLQGKKKMNSGHISALRRSFSSPITLFSNVDLFDHFAEEDRFFDNQLKNAGRYYVKKPEAMYNKSRMWLENRERSLQKLHEERLREDADECLFRPQWVSSAGRARQLSVRTASTTCDDPAVVAHLERQEEARQRRAEAERRAFGGNGSKWKNKLTVPKEFELGKKTIPIPSLRRPFVGAVPLKDADKELVANVGPEKSRVDGEHNVNHLNFGVSHRQDDHQGTRWKEECVAKGVSVLRPFDDNAREVKNSDRRDSNLSEVVMRLEATIARLQEELAKKDQALQQQKGELMLLTRELEVAKKTVQNLSLQNVVVVEMGGDTATPRQHPFMNYKETLQASEQSQIF